MAVRKKRMNKRVSAIEDEYEIIIDNKDGSISKYYLPKDLADLV